MELDEAKEILNDNGYILTERAATVESVAREIKKLLRTKYEIKERSKLQTYMEDLVPFKVPLMYSASSYASKLCKDYFGW